MAQLLASAVLPSTLVAALARVRQCCIEACEQSIQGLQLSALSTSGPQQRDLLLGALSALQRGLALLVQTFDESFETRVRHEWRAPPEPALERSTSWDELSLVEDEELERQVVSERFARTIGHGSEWELRELEGFLRALANDLHRAGHAPPNVLRPENIACAMVRGIDTLAINADERRVLETEISRSMSTRLPRLYASVVAELRASGLKPMALSVRPRENGSSSGGAVQRTAEHTAFGVTPRPHATLHGSPMEPPGRGGPSPSAWPAVRPRESADPALMNLLRRLARWNPGDDAMRGNDGTTPRDNRGPMPNLIREHRAELQEMAQGAMDHMVIDVIGSLFDHILSDPKVPPQIARELGRLQLPVLRAAMADPSFFASRRHPVRRLVNRIASLGTALDDPESDSATALVSCIRELVHGIVQGDFDRPGLFEAQLDRLERFVAEQARLELEAKGAQPSLLAEREADLRRQRRSARKLKLELHPLQAPDFVRDFIADVWSQVLVRMARQDGEGSDAFRQAHRTAHDLFMSVLPKGTPAQRQEFLRSLPRLMQQLNRGMDLVAWPDEARKSFFGQLLPAHAQSLKGEGLRTLDYNLLSRQVDQILERAMTRPGEREAGPPSAPTPLDSDHGPLLTPSEAEVVGLLGEHEVDWQTLPDQDPAEEPAVSPADLSIQGLPEPDAPEPTRGRLLADHVQIGFAYQMHIEGRWQKVRLTHVSPARAFYMFSRGTRHQQMLSLTRRMLLKLCETGRLRAFEHAYLLERATARTRRQLAAVKSP